MVGHDFMFYALGPLLFEVQEAVDLINPWIKQDEFSSDEEN